MACGKPSKKPVVKPTRKPTRKPTVKPPSKPTNAVVEVECSICMDDVDSTKIIRCGCGTDTCDGCVLDNLRQDRRLMCHKCETPWTRVFIYQHFSKVLINQVDDIRKQQLWEAEQSRFAETAELAGEQKKLDMINREIWDLRLQLRAKLDEQRILRYRVNAIRAGQDPTDVDDALVEEIKPVKRQFVQACGDPECRGFVSTRYVCHICAKVTCKDCLEIKTDGHTCDPGVVASVKQIKRSSVKCPGPKCGAYIQRVSGCNQMWCTECHTAFDYRTRKIVNGVIHNPHYFEAKNKGLLTDGPVMIGECGGFPMGRYDLPTTELIQLGIDFNQTVYRPFQQAAEVDNLDQRIRYLNGDITKAQMISNLTRRDKKHNKEVEMYMVYDLMNTTLVEKCRMIVEGRKKDRAQHLTELHKVRELCNDKLKELSELFQQQVQLIQKDFRLATFGSSTRAVRLGLKRDDGKCQALIKSGKRQCNRRAARGDVLCSTHAKRVWTEAE